MTQHQISDPPPPAMTPCLAGLRTRERVQNGRAGPSGVDIPCPSEGAAVRRPTATPIARSDWRNKVPAVHIRRRSIPALSHNIAVHHEHAVDLPWNELTQPVFDTCSMAREEKG